MVFIIFYHATVLTFVAAAQTFPVQVIPQMIPPYSLKLSEYQTTTSEKLLVNLLLTDTREAGRRIRLKMYIEGQGLQIRNLDFVTGAEPLYLDGGASKRLTNLDLQAYFSLKNLLGISPQQYNRALPGGRYNFCFEIYDFFSGRLLSRKSCVSAYLILNDPPILNMPSRGELVVAKTPQNILFSWTPRHLSAAGVRYEFTLKELWDTGVDPRAAFLSSPPLYQEQTFTPTLLYGPDKIPLLEGKTYGWQVRALVTDGINETSVFKNNGNSEIFYFRYESHCDPPRLSIPQILGETTVQMGWEGSYNHNKYKLQYRKVGYSEETDKQRARREKKNKKRAKKGKEEKEYKPHKVDYDWFEVYTADQQAQLSKLESGQVYEYRVGATCTPLTQLTHYYVYSQIKEFRMITEKSAAEEAAYKCGILSEVKIANQDPLQSLKAGDGFTAGGFPVVAEEVQGSDGKFSGKGFFKTQYLKKFNIAVTFDNITINTDRQMIKGEVVTTYDASWGGILDIDAVASDVKGFVKTVYTTLKDALEGLGISEGDYSEESVDFEIKDITIIESNDIIVTGITGEKKNLGKDKNLVITDNNGKKTVISTNGKTAIIKKENTKTIEETRDTPYFIEIKERKQQYKYNSIIYFIRQKKQIKLSLKTTIDSLRFKEPIWKMTGVTIGKGDSILIELKELIDNKEVIIIDENNSNNYFKFKLKVYEKPIVKFTVENDYSGTFLFDDASEKILQGEGHYENINKFIFNKDYEIDEKKDYFVPILGTKKDQVVQIRMNIIGETINDPDFQITLKSTNEDNITINKKKNVNISYNKDLYIEIQHELNAYIEAYDQSGELVGKLKVISKKTESFKNKKTKLIYIEDVDGKILSNTNLDMTEESLMNILNNYGHNQIYVKWDNDQKTEVINIKDLANAYLAKNNSNINPQIINIYEMIKILKTNNTKLYKAYEYYSNIGNIHNNYNILFLLPYKFPGLNGLHFFLQKDELIGRYTFIFNKGPDVVIHEQGHDLGLKHIYEDYPNIPMKSTKNFMDNNPARIHFILYQLKYIELNTSSDN